MAVRLLLIQLLICCFWLAFILSGLNPITLPLVAALTLLPLVGVIGAARIAPVNVIPIMVLFVVGYLAWSSGWDPQGPAYAFVSGLVFFVTWTGCTQVPDQTRMPAVWLGLVLYSPLFIMALNAVMNGQSIWPALIGIAVQFGALVFALRNDWSVSTAFTDVTVLRMNGLAMLMLPVIYLTDPLAIFGTHEHILGIGGAISAIVMTRQQLAFRRRLNAANKELEDYTYRDQLTGTKTWAGLIDHLAAHPAETVSMVCIDIDYFGRLNSQQGFEVGDQVLRYLARALPEALPDYAHARIGGDFFVLVRRNAHANADVVEATVSALMHTYDPSLGVTATAGHSQPGTMADLEELLAQCDLDIAQRRRKRGRVIHTVRQ